MMVHQGTGRKHLARYFMPVQSLPRSEVHGSQTSVWLSTDPVLGDYLPTAGADNSSLPGMGGVFNTTNSHLYHYAGNNPVRYVDPDGCQAEACFDIEYFQTQVQLIERSIPELVTVAETVGIVAEQPNILSNLPKLGKAAVVFGIVFSV